MAAWPWFAAAGFTLGALFAAYTAPVPVEPKVCPAGTRVQIVEADGTTRCLLDGKRAGPGDVVFVREI